MYVNSFFIAIGWDISILILNIHVHFLRSLSDPYVRLWYVNPHTAIEENIYIILKWNIFVIYPSLLDMKYCLFSYIMNIKVIMSKYWYNLSLMHVENSKSNVGLTWSALINYNAGIPISNNAGIPGSPSLGK